MMDKNLKAELLDGFEEVIKRSGVDYMCVTGERDFLRKLFEHKMNFVGFVIVRSDKESGLFFFDSNDESASAGACRIGRSFKKSDFDIPYNPFD